jgi:hypothetical protein
MLTKREQLGGANLNVLQPGVVVREHDEVMGDDEVTQMHECVVVVGLRIASKKATRLAITLHSFSLTRSQVNHMGWPPPTPPRPPRVVLGPSRADLPHHPERVRHSSQEHGAVQQGVH